MGDSSRAHLLGERWEADRHFGHLRVLYGAAALHQPDLDPDTGIVARLLAHHDQEPGAVDALDWLYLPLDEAALALAELPAEEHDELLLAYGERVAADPALPRTLSHQGSAPTVRQFLPRTANRPGFPPRTKSFLGIVVAHGQGLPADRMRQIVADCPPDPEGEQLRAAAQARAGALSAALAQYDDTKARVTVAAARRAVARLTEKETG
ncbi:hypothetical protein [Streptomyces sp. NPDC088557]|uniref:hypothetical protein n=1 Tax=Streptomyces sp. NPDC088557 TaxID=3365867 RepID=UPI00381E5302